MPPKPVRVRVRDTEDMEAMLLFAAEGAIAILPALGRRGTGAMVDVANGSAAVMALLLLPPPLVWGRKGRSAACSARLHVARMATWEEMR